jgi:YebC/PmpR family DNA-binding regulatory protein
MAGHSAWKNIKHRKAAVDAKRGKLWSKASRAIIMAAKSGGGDPRFNAGLRLAIDEAKAVNMPRDTIEKAVKKGTGELDSESYEAVRYEGYATGGVAVIAECLVCNVNRTAPEIRTIFDKNGGNLGVPGSVSYSFAQQGSIIVDGEKASEERLMEVALEAGAQDIRDLGGAWQVLTAPADLSKVKESLESASIALESAEIAWIPGMMVQVDPASGAAVQKLIDALEEHDDVQKVFTNAEFAE